MASAFLGARGGAIVDQGDMIDVYVNVK